MGVLSLNTISLEFMCDNISFKYNRLVMFNPAMWHSNGDWFGNTYDNSRLVQLFFFHGV